MAGIEVTADCISNLQTQLVKGVRFRENCCAKRHCRIPALWRFSDFED